MKIRILFLLTLLGATLARAQTGTPTSAPPAATNATSAKEYLSSTAVDAENRDLKPGDVFQFVIEEDPGRSVSPMSVKVSDGGEAMFPVSQSGPQYVKVNVRGKKLADLRREVKDLLDADYYEHCTVRLDLNQINRAGASTEGLGKVVVYGELQGVVQLPENKALRISDAIISVGNNKFANLSKVRLHRQDATSGKEEIKLVNVDKILREGDRTDDIVLQDGDRIEVRPRTFNF
jgi:protein involved in polysaccharide export with SLBB domain